MRLGTLRLSSRSFWLRDCMVMSGFQLSFRLDRLPFELAEAQIVARTF